MKTSKHVALGFVAAGLVGSVAAVADAQPYVQAPGRAIAGGDDVSTIAYNPANLVFLPGAELRWTFVYPQETGYTGGNAVEAGFSFFNLATGLRVDWLDINTPTGFTASQRWLRWAFAAKLGEKSSFGTTIGWSFSNRNEFDGAYGVTTAYTVRPFSWLSGSILARDWTHASGRTYELGLALRPWKGQRVIEIGAEASLREATQDTTLRGTLGFDIPRFGRFRSDVSVSQFDSKPNVTAMVGVDVNFSVLQAGVGGIGGNGDAGFYATAAVRTFKEPGIRLPKKVSKIRIDNVPGVRKHTQLLKRLWKLAEDPEVAGVMLDLRAEPASSLAHAEEVGDAIRRLRAYGKKVMCHLEDAGGKSLYVCAQADRIAMNPAGGLRFAGLSSQYMYYGGVLEKLGVRSDFVRIAEHKLAAEQYTRKESSEIGRVDHRELLAQLENIYMSDVGGGRRIPLVTLRKTMERGPFIAPEARTENLIDVLAYTDEMKRFAEETMGQPVRMVEDKPAAEAPNYWGAPAKVAIVYLSGDMVDGESQSIPFVGIRLAGSYTIANALKKAREDSTVKAVVFRIETGGGSSLAADVILREAILTAKKKPLIVSMGSAAASGGYYASVVGGPIYANRSTITGSIGIFYGKVDVVGLLGKLGVGLEQFRSAPKADAESFYRPFTDDEKKELGVKVKQFYDLFIARVAEGRRMKPEDIDAVARGRVWTGAQAKDRKLVDHIGGLREALAEARKRADLPPDATIVEYPEEDDSLLGSLAKLVGISAAPQPGMAGVFIPPVFMDMARGLAPMMVFDGSKPLARMDMIGDVSYGSLTPAGNDDEP
jgi:protease IV